MHTFQPLGPDFGGPHQSLLVGYGKLWDKFHIDRYDKSALSMHTYTDHPEKFDDSLSNFKVVILESTNAINLNRRESYYIWSTEAEQVQSGQVNLGNIKLDNLSRYFSRWGDIMRYDKSV